MGYLHAVMGFKAKVPSTYSADSIIQFDPNAQLIPFISKS